MEKQNGPGSEGRSRTSKPYEGPKKLAAVRNGYVTRRYVGRKGTNSQNREKEESAIRVKYHFADVG